MKVKPKIYCLLAGAADVIQYGWLADWVVEDIEKTIEELLNSSDRIEDYDFEELDPEQTINFFKRINSHFKEGKEPNLFKELDIFLNIHGE